MVPLDSSRRAGRGSRCDFLRTRCRSARLVLGQGLVLVGSGTGAGLLAAFGLTRFLEKLLHGVAPADPVTFPGVAVILMLVAIAASWLPARRASRVDPVVALRHE